MAEESRSQTREFQLETRHLAAIVAVMAIFCISSFLLGRWVERQATRTTIDSGPRVGESGSVPVEDVNRELTYFRTLEEDAGRAHGNDERLSVENVGFGLRMLYDVLRYVQQDVRLQP